MKTKELRQKSDKELRNTLNDLRDHLRDLRFNLASGKVKNIKEIHQTKKDISRILTLLNKKTATIEIQKKRKEQK